MNKNVKKLIAGITSYGFILSATLTSVTASPLPVSYAANMRLGGTNRYETAAIVSNNGWSNGSDYVIIARGDDFADALCAAPLAKLYDAPILLTESSKLNSSTKAEIKTLNPKHIIIVGGTGAVASGVEKELKSLTSDVQRISGKDRYDTSVKVANILGSSTKVAVVRGDKFADALSIAPIAAAEGMPVILTQTDKLPDEVKAYLDANKISVSYVIGGTGAVSDAVKAKLPGADRISGSDRFDTNKNVLENFAEDLNFEKVYVAVGDGTKGNEFADALSASALAAKTSSPVVLEYKGIKAGTANFINDSITPKTAVIAVGGTAVVSDNDIKTLTIAKQDYSTDEKTYSNEQVSTNANITGKNIVFKDGKISGNVYVYGDGAQLSNVQVAGTVFVDPGESGSVTLNGVKADKIKVLSGAQNCVHLVDVSANALAVESKNQTAAVRIISQGTTSILSTIVKSDVTLDNTAGTFGSVEIKTTGSRSKKVGFSGKFSKPVVVEGSAELRAAAGAQLAEVRVNTASSNAVVNFAGGNLGNVTIENASRMIVGAAVTVQITPASADAAKGITIDVAKGAVVTLPKDSGIIVTGPGESDVIISDGTTPSIPGIVTPSTVKTFTLTTPNTTYTTSIDASKTVEDIYNSSIGAYINMYTLKNSNYAASMQDRLTKILIGGVPANQYIANILRTKNSGSTLADLLDNASTHQVDVDGLISYVKNHNFSFVSLMMLSDFNDDITIPSNEDIVISGKTVGSISYEDSLGQTQVLYDSTHRTFKLIDLKTAFFGSSIDLSGTTLQTLLNQNLNVTVKEKTTNNVIYSAVKNSDGSYTITNAYAAPSKTYTLTIQ